MTKKGTTLKDGQWIYRRLGEKWRNPTPICEGDWDNRKKVGEVSRMQAMALARWHGDPVVFFSVRDGNGRWIDIRVAGDIDAFYGD